MKKVKVLDSWALLAFLEDDASAEKVEELIIAAQEGKLELLITATNLGQVWYTLSRVSSDNRADEAERHIRRLGITVVDTDWNLARQAAVFRSKNKIAYSNCLAAALAKQRKGELVTGDRDFKALEADIKILWI